MPGMMDTVLNLGLNDQTVEGLAKLSGDRRFAFDSYRRFIQMYSNVVLDLDHHLFEEILDDHKDRLRRHRRHRPDRRRLGSGGRRLQGRRRSASSASPSRRTPRTSCWGAVGAVFASWMNDRAKFYRRMHDIPESWGTAVNIQSMVFGNMGDTSATGVAFTRNPSTGENRLYGEFLINAQGEDVVAGIRTPQALTQAAREEMGDDAPLDGRGACRRCSPQFKAVVETAGAPLPRHAGHRVHGRAGPALHAADPQRQAHRQGRAEDRRRHGRRGRDHRGRGDHARRAGARSTSCCTRPSTPTPSAT